MKHQEIKILLGMLLLFSGLIGIFYQSTTKQEFVESDSPLHEAVPSQALDYLSLLAAAESVEAMVSLMRGLSINQIESLIKPLIELKAMNRFDLLELLSALALQHTDNPKAIDTLLSLAFVYPSSEQQEPILVLIASSMYKNALDIWNRWAPTHQAGAHLVPDAYQYAVEKNQPDVIKTLLHNRVLPDPLQAQKLLWSVIETDKDPAFIPLLIQAGAQVNTPNHEQKTFLIRATQKNQHAHVQELIQAGADVNQMPTPAMGTALQAALEGGHSDIALFLREKGAR